MSYSREKKRTERLITREATIRTNLLTWLSIHGNLCLALRHPKNRGASRPLVVNFVKQLGKSLVEWGAVTPEELRKAERLEREEGSRDL